MTKEEAIENAKWNSLFLFVNPEWKCDKEVVLAAVREDGLALYHVSNKLTNDIEIVLTAVKQNGDALAYATNRLRENKEIVLAAINSNTNACKHSSLKNYQSFDEIVKKEGEEFLFSCWNNKSWNTRLLVANHPNYLPTEEQIAIGLEDNYDEVRQIYESRKDEWLAKIEENKLKKIYIKKN